MQDDHAFDGSPRFRFCSGCHAWEPHGHSPTCAPGEHRWVYEGDETGGSATVAPGQTELFDVEAENP